MILADRDQEMNMIRGSSGADKSGVKTTQDAADVGVKFGFDLRREKREAVLRREDDVKICAEYRLGHVRIRPLQGRIDFAPSIVGLHPTLLNLSLPGTIGKDRYSPERRGRWLGTLFRRLWRLGGRSRGGPGRRLLGSR